MKGSSNIYHRPYIPANRPEWRDMPYICRIAPSERGFSMEWIPAPADTGEHFLYYSRRGEDSFTRIPLTGPTASVTDLEPETEYEFYIENSRGRKSLTRLIRTGALPAGTVAVNYLHPDDNAFEFSGKYFGSPSLARLRDGCIRFPYGAESDHALRIPRRRAELAVPEPSVPVLLGQSFRT